MTAFRLFVLALAVLGLPLSAFGDVVYFKSGKILKGLMVEEHRDRIIFSMEEGEKEIVREEIDEVFFDDPEWNYLYLGNQAADEGEYRLALSLLQRAVRLKPGFQQAEDSIRWLDDLQAKLKMSPEELDRPVRLLEKNWGLKIRTAQDLPLVKKVKRESFAAKTGLKKGDRLVAVWGRSLRFLELAESAEALVGPSGTEVKLTVERKVRLQPKGEQGTGAWPGVNLSMESMGLSVQKLDADGVARTSGLLEGDRVVAIGDRATRYLPLREAKQLIQEHSKEPLTLVIHRDLIFNRR
jgi:membrane-associated protease RseP (regulator of RpoE activity)